MDAGNRDIRYFQVRVVAASHLDQRLVGGWHKYVNSSGEVLVFAESFELEEVAFRMLGVDQAVDGTIRAYRD